MSICQHCIFQSLLNKETCLFGSNNKLSETAKNMIFYCFLENFKQGTETIFVYSWGLTQVKIMTSSASKYNRI